MENGKYMGVYIARQGVPGPSLPMANASGLWQVWFLDDNSVLVQPLTSDKEPWGSVSQIAQETFQYVLAPMPSDSEIAAVSKKFMQADSPDLIDIWFDHSISYLKKSSGETGSLNVDAVPAELAQAVQTDIITAGQEDVLAGFVPVNEDTLATWENPFDGIANAAALLAIKKEKEIFEAPVPQAAEDGGNAASPEESPAPEQSVAQNAAPVDTASVEKDLRSKFAFIFERLENPPSPEIEEAMLRVLDAREGITSEHRYMFSEFGMELRRKKLTDLALTAHRRALELAPQDGYVLFNLARSEYESGDIKTAREHLKQTLKVLPDFVPAVNFLKFLGGD